MCKREREGERERSSKIVKYFSPVDPNLSFTALQNILAWICAELVFSWWMVPYPSIPLPSIALQFVKAFSEYGKLSVCGNC